MSAQSLAVGALLSLGVLAALLCVLGVLVGRDAYQKLHYLGPLAPLSAFLIAAAVIAQESWSQAGLKALLVALVLLIAGPVLTHATARAAHLRESEAPENPEPFEHAHERKARS